MRLWQKIALICTAVLLAVLLLICALTLNSVRNAILELTVTNAKEKQAALAKSFVNQGDYALQAELTPEERDAVILEIFSDYADETGVLVQNFDTLYSFINMQPQDILMLSTTDQRVFLDALGSRNYLIVGSLVKLEAVTTPYAVYVVRDITTVYQSFDATAMRLIIAALMGMALGAGAIILLVRNASKPLKQLSLSAKRIADGEFAERAQVDSHDEVGELAKDFNRMAEAVETHVEALEERNTRQELFIGGLTHEFKTPMTSILLHSETLLNNPKLTKEQREQSLHHIRTQIQWLERLTQKLMALVNMGQQLRVSETPVEPLLCQVAESVAETMEQRNTPLKVECDIATLPMDPDLMRSLLINLVDNASKASESGQEILLCAHGSTLSVTDHGRGIPAESIERITEPFYMVDKSRSKRQGGSGLGLALVKRIADAHNATLDILSAPGEGTVIRVTFQQPQAEAAEAKES